METAKKRCISYDLEPSETSSTFLKYVHKLTPDLLKFYTSQKPQNPDGLTFF